MRLLLTAMLACLYTEFTGYALHRFLHSGSIAWMTRRHLVHHLDFYAPTMKMRTPTYLDRERTDGIAGVGWEWIAPSLVLTVTELFVLAWLGTAPLTQVVFFTVGLSWSVVMFYGAHEAMHVTRPSAFETWPMRRWFIHARRMHAIHHVAIDPTGRFLGNFGIIAHGFDRLFGTYLRRVPHPHAAASAPGKRTNA